MDIETIIRQAEKKQSEIYKKSEKMEKIAVMGGTFDPIHHGHLVIAEQIRCEYNLDKVVFIPAGIPPHKTALPVSDAKHRYAMALLATVTNPYFEVSKIEIEDDSISYTIHTIKKLREIYKDNTELFFITGADAICDIETWKDVDELLHICHFIAATRPGLESPYVDKKINDLQKKYQADIYQMNVPALAISSTDIRRRVTQNQSIKYLVPESVEYYIYKNGLYR